VTRRDSSHWSYRLAEFAERKLGWLAAVIVVAGLLLLDSQ
jgi:hypothetical protein